MTLFLFDSKNQYLFHVYKPKFKNEHERIMSIQETGDRIRQTERQTKKVRLAVMRLADIETDKQTDTRARQTNKNTRTDICQRKNKRKRQIDEQNLYRQIMPRAT